MVAQRPQLHLNQARIECAARDAVRQVRLEQFRKERDDIEAHRPSQ
jgi:hypothetical protein